MNEFDARKIAKAWAERFGRTGGTEEQAYLSGVKAALEYAMSRCNSGSTPSMIRRDLYNKIADIEGKERS